MERLAAAKCVIIKVGSSLLVDPQNGQLRLSWMAALATDIADLRARGCQVVLVSSGAVAVGRNQMQIKASGLRLEDAQALAAIGQVRLAGAWANSFAPLGIELGQVLLTLDDTENRRRWLNSSLTLRTLLQMGALPLINENDSVASDEIRYGDNDRLAARMAQMVGADLLVLLSDVDGLYSADPSSDPDAVHMPLIERISPQIEAMASIAVSTTGSGGMTTKLMAARIAATAGCATIIASGTQNAPLDALISETGKCSLFLPDIKPAQARKNWIAGTVQPRGTLEIDTGAAQALAKGASLLAAGLAAVSGTFERGEVVSICRVGGDELARGIVSYSAGELQKIQGLRSEKIPEVLGYEARKAVVHRDNLVLTGRGNYG
ncbi:MAG: glutamate 5-kinase [Robiginitomaculum sp.]|nr:MAG: glutamate 5-kinase [Robiginitomaculum sp.]